MIVHEVKILKKYADDIASGLKNFEVRKNDRGYEVGDKLKFTVIEDGIEQPEHPINGEEYEITYMHSGLGLQDGYVILGITMQKWLGVRSNT